MTKVTIEGFHSGYCLRDEQNFWLHSNESTQSEGHWILYDYALGFSEKKDSNIVGIAHSATEADQKLYEMVRAHAVNLREGKIRKTDPVTDRPISIDEIVDNTSHANAGATN